MSGCASNVRSLDYCINRAIYKIFSVGSPECIRHFMGLRELGTLIEERRFVFDFISVPV